MFKKITPSQVNAIEVKNRIIVYAALKSESKPQEIWHGELSKYILNLRLSGIIQEKKILQGSSGSPQNSTSSYRTENSSKFIYYESDAFVQEYRYLNHEDFVEKMYQVYLKRNADLGGKQDNVNKLTIGNSRQNLITAIRSSEEGCTAFLKSTSCLNHKVFLDLTYRIYLGSLPHADNQIFYLRSLQQGTSRNELLIQIQQFKKSIEVLNSLESSFYLSNEAFCQSCDKLSNEDFINKIYHAFLKREADSGGKEDKIQKLQQNISRQVILADLRQSEEAFNVFLITTSCLSDQQFIDAVYLTYLRDKPDSEAKSLAIKKIDRGESRQQVFQSLLKFND